MKNTSSRQETQLLTSSNKPTSSQCIRVAVDCHAGLVSSNFPLFLYFSRFLLISVHFLCYEYVQTAASYPKQPTYRIQEYNKWSYGMMVVLSGTTVFQLLLNTVVLSSSWKTVVSVPINTFWLLCLYSAYGSQEIYILDVLAWYYFIQTDRFSCLYKLTNSIFLKIQCLPLQIVVLFPY